MSKIYESSRVPGQSPEDPPAYFIEDKNEDGYFQETAGDKIYIDVDQNFELDPNKDRVVQVPEEKAQLIKHLGLKGIDGVSIQALTDLDNTARRFRVSVRDSLNSPETNQHRGNLYDAVYGVFHDRIDKKPPDEDLNRVVRGIRENAGEYRLEKEKFAPEAVQYLQRTADDKRISADELSYRFYNIGPNRFETPEAREQVRTGLKSLFEEAASKAEKALSGKKKDVKTASFYIERATVYHNYFLGSLDPAGGEPLPSEQKYNDLKTKLGL